jgi:hypothetical protein
MGPLSLITIAISKLEFCFFVVSKFVTGLIPFIGVNKLEIIFLPALHYVPTRKNRKLAAKPNRIFAAHADKRGGIAPA